MVDLREYAAILRRRSLVIAILALLGLGLALGYSELQTPIYSSTAKVLVNPPPGDTSQNLSNLISVDTEAQVVKSAPVAGIAAGELNSPLVPTQLLKHVSVNTTANTFVMDISYQDPDPLQAARGANAFAKAYLEYKTQQAADLIDQQRSSIESQIAELNREQTHQNRIIDTATPGSIAYRNAQDALSQISVKFAVLASSLDQLPQIVNPGQVILPAVEPKASSSPKVPLNAAVGLFLGLL